jgi:hypothetical protein
MTAKEKSDQLLIKFLTASFGTMEEYVPVPREFAKQCAIIAVDEIIASSPSLPILGDGGYLSEDIDLSEIYWQDVLNHLNNC